MQRGKGELPEPRKKAHQVQGEWTLELRHAINDKSATRFGRLLVSFTEMVFPKFQIQSQASDHSRHDDGPQPQKAKPPRNQGGSQGTVHHAYRQMMT